MQLFTSSCGIANGALFFYLTGCFLSTFQVHDSFGMQPWPIATQDTLKKLINQSQ